MRWVGSAGVLVVALALILTAAPGAQAPGTQMAFTLTSGEFVGRLRDVASRDAERAPVPPAEPAPAPSEVAPEASAPPAPPAEPSPAAPQPAPQAPAATRAAARPAAAAGGGGENPTMSEEIVGLTNAERAAQGLPALTVSSCATQQAVERSAVLVAEGRFEHDPLGPILEACAAGTVGENLSLGYPSAQAAVTGWMNSAGHKENILRSSFTQIGVACTQDRRGWLCMQVFLG